MYIATYCNERLNAFLLRYLVSKLEEGMPALEAAVNLRITFQLQTMQSHELPLVHTGLGVLEFDRTVDCSYHILSEENGESSFLVRDVENLSKVHFVCLAITSGGTVERKNRKSF